MRASDFQTDFHPDEILTDPDGSINYVWHAGIGRAVEARYVRRKDHEIRVYLSSQTACSQACRMCHLTRTGQTRPGDVSQGSLFAQATNVLEPAPRGGVKIVNFNFMARGEPLLNPNVNGDTLQGLAEIAHSYGLVPRFKISTIMPAEIPSTNLFERFGAITPDIYYSFYFVDDELRRRWFPKAMDYRLALTALAIWQEFTHKIPRIHFPVIADVNDRPDQVADMVNAILEAGLRVDFNIIRYNPFDERDGQEGDWQGVMSLLRDLMPESDVEDIKRVGPTAKASCGMFTEGGR